MRRSVLQLTILLVSCSAVMSGEPSPSSSKEFVIYAPSPKYPLEAKRQHLEGTGLYAAHIRPDGSVASVEIVKSSAPILDVAAVTALRKWRYRPSKSMRVITIPLTFTMSGYDGR